MSQKCLAYVREICCLRLPVLILAVVLISLETQAQTPSLAESTADAQPEHRALAATLAVTKVDPPSWWIGSVTNPIRLLIAGQGLGKELILTADREGLQFTNLRASQNGHYLFADLHIAPDCKPGQVQFELSVGDPQTSPQTCPQRTMFAWEVLEAPAHQPQGFGPEDFIYFLMPDRFCDGDPANNRTEKSPAIYDRSKSRFYHGGDIQGIASKLDYIQSLGATAIWTTPIYDNNDAPDLKEMHPEPGGSKPVPTTGYHGYGAIDLYAVDEHFGTLKEVQAWIAQSHRRGLKVIQDQVANHTGPYHAWVQDPPTQTWWNGTAAKHPKNNWQKWTAMNPRATRQTQQLNLDGWFADVLPDLNQDDPEVAKYLIQHSIWWLGVAGFDAIRMDTLPHVPRSFWGKWAGAVKREFPNTKVLGELFDADPVLVAYYQGGRRGHDQIDTQIDTLFDFGLFTPIRNAFAKGKALRDVHQMFARDWLYVDPNRLATFVGVHDMPRFMHEKGATIQGLQAAMTLMMTSRGTPILYYGDELAMPGGEDPDNRRDFPGGFPGDTRNAFDPAGRVPTESTVWNHIARLGALRKKYPELALGKSLDLLDAQQQYVYARLGDRQTLLVAINNDTEPATIEFDAHALPCQAIFKGWSFQCDDLLGGADRLTVQVEVPNPGPKEDTVEATDEVSAVRAAASLTLPARTSAVFLLPE
ncbi:MAG: alpha-amylase family glycosyl hydrolase [Planctomycetota bacterium]|nr:alpha-amylase family glycosyl hydrolase [Planctomycetota bacterium]